MWSKSARLYNLWHLFRRITLVIIALELAERPDFQLLSVLGLCLASQIYLCQVQIFKDKFYYIIDVFNDYFVYLAAIHSVVLLTVSYDVDTQNVVGSSLVYTVIF